MRDILPRLKSEVFPLTRIRRSVLKAALNVQTPAKIDFCQIDQYNDGTLIGINHYGAVSAP